MATATFNGASFVAISETSLLIFTADPEESAVVVTVAAEREFACTSYFTVEVEEGNVLGMEFSDDVCDTTYCRQTSCNEWLDLGVTNDVKKYISKVDCIVLPSYREGTPRVLLEAASMAKPIVTTNVPGCKEVVDDGINGYLCEVRSSVDLAEKMENMFLLSREERLNKGKLGRKKMINQFDDKLVIDKYLKIIDKLIIK